jgi:Tol biopolymer transport system component
MVSLQRAVRLMGVILITLAITAGLPGQGGFHGTAMGHAQLASAAADVRLAHNGRIAFDLSTVKAGWIETIKPDGSHVERLTQTCTIFTSYLCGYSEYAWSPDGRRMVLLEGHLHVRCSGRSCVATTFTQFLNVINANGTGEKQLAQCVGETNQSASCMNPDDSPLSWSPDGKQVAFSRQAGQCGYIGPRHIAQCKYWLYIVNAATGRVRRLTRCAPRPCYDTMPTWSPDGARIAAVRNESLFVMNAIGSVLRRLPQLGAAQDPTWSPDGSSIAYESHGQIYTIRPDGSAIALLTRFSGALKYGTESPVWSPDGSQIAFFRTPGRPKWNTRELWVMGANGSHLRRLYREPIFTLGAPDRPGWSPDGKYIAFGGTHRAGKVFVGFYNLYVIDANGGIPHLLFHLPKSEGDQPAWQPVP